MLKLECSPEAIEALRYWRFHHPHPLVQLKMEVVLLHSQGVPNEQIQPGVMKKRVIPPPGIDPVFVPLACEVPRPFSSSLVQRVQGFFCTKRAPVWCKRLPELFVSPLLWWWRPSQQHSRSGQSIHSLPGPVPSV